jgi:hypothetical protein
MKKLNRRSSTVTYALWIVQGLLALVFLFAGGMKLRWTERANRSLKW